MRCLKTEFTCVVTWQTFELINCYSPGVAIWQHQGNHPKPKRPKKLGKLRANINGVVVSMFIFSQPRGDVITDLKVMISVMQLRSR